jgi:membrane protein
VPAATKPSGFWGFLRTRLLSFGLVLGLGFLLLVSLVFSAAVAAAGSWWGNYFVDWETVLHMVNLIVSLALSTTLFGMIYKLLPRTKIAWRDVWVGAVVTAVLLETGKIGIGLYLGKSGVTSGFGAAGSLAVLLIWVYYSAQIFLLGAEFTRIYSRHSANESEGTATPGTLEHSRRGAERRAQKPMASSQRTA